MIRNLASKGGLIGVNFASYFLGESNISMISDYVKHIKHIKNVGGVESVAFGSDFDGISSKLEVKNIGNMNLVIEEMEKQGFSIDEIEKISHKNSIRLIKDILT